MKGTRDYDWALSVSDATLSFGYILAYKIDTVGSVLGREKIIGCSCLHRDSVRRCRCDQGSNVVPSLRLSHPQ